MPENEKIPELETAPLDQDDWEIAFEPYKSDPFAALTLGYHLAGLLRYINDPKAKTDAVAAVNHAIDALFECSQFRNVSYELFRTTIEGRLTAEEDKQIRKLGIRI